MTNQNMLYLLYHFLNEICTINLLVKQNEIFLSNMESNPLFESLLHIILKVLSFLLPITLYYLSNSPLINHENILLELLDDGAFFEKKYQKPLLCFKLICFNLSHAKFSRNDL